MANKTTLFLVLIIMVVASVADTCTRPEKFNSASAVKEYINCIKTLYQDPRYGKRSFPDSEAEIATSSELHNDYDQAYEDWLLYKILKLERRI